MHSLLNRTTGNQINVNDIRVDLSIIKLEKLGLIEKENVINNQGESYYSYKLTHDGLEIILCNENKLHNKFAPKSPTEDHLPF